MSPSDLILQVDIHDKNGSQVFSNKNLLEIKNNEKKLLKIDFNQILKNLKFQDNDNFAAHIITYSKNTKIPSRIKFGLDIGIKNSDSKLPCNICFNTRMGNPLLEKKPGSFHWAPLFNERNTVITLGNFSTQKNYQRNANLELIFYRIEDDNSLNKKISLEYDMFPAFTNNTLYGYIDNARDSLRNHTCTSYGQLRRQACAAIQTFSSFVI